MPTAVHLHTKVLPGNRIDVSSPELLEGSSVEVIILDLVSKEIATFQRYPDALNTEYNTLVNKDINNALTAEESIR